MKKITQYLLSLTSSLILLSACNMATPENYFDRAVLNINMMTGFASDGMLRQLQSPSVKMIDGDKNKSAPMKRKEIVDNQIQYLEEEFEKVKDLKETPETKSMLEASIALYEYVLPVYKNEYQQLAKLYDENASPEAIQASAQNISAKYFPGFIKLFDQLTVFGKAYAEKNNIKVNWDVHTSPQ